MKSVIVSVLLVFLLASTVKSETVGGQQFLEVLAQFLSANSMEVLSGLHELVNGGDDGFELEICIEDINIFGCILTDSGYEPYKVKMC